jgi:hypothetical protein
MTKHEQAGEQLQACLEHYSQRAIEAIGKGLSSTAGLYACYACYFAKFLIEDRPEDRTEPETEWKGITI